MKGGSAIIGPDSKYVVDPVFEEPCIIYADLELDRITEGHLFLDTDRSLLTSRHLSPGGERRTSKERNLRAGEQGS